MKTKTLGFIGGGRITRIILQAFVNKKAIFGSISVFDTNAETLRSLKQKFPFIEILNSVSEAARKDIVFIALHPPVIMDTLQTIAKDVNEKTVLISLAPKITISKIASVLISVHYIARLIPNATSIINHGYNPVSFGPGVPDIEKAYIMEMLNLLGETFETDEEKLEAYAMLSAMLPTYFWFQWKELETLGIEFGLTEAECRESIFETVNAALNTMYHSGLTAEEVMDLIPVKPIGESEPQIKGIYDEKLRTLFGKIKPERLILCDSIN
ncbi:MAG: NAD(P)-binding domain-containing protein [Verrucomicrobia bacterium]|nr:NAD(P)-binding domain-containing protein [Prolixibacteraceae bacterium]